MDNFPFEHAPTDAYELVDDGEFINIVYMHWVLKTNVLVSLERVEQSLSNIRNLVRSGLDTD